MPLRIAVVILFIACPAICLADAGNSFREYWGFFRAAVLVNDQEKVASMTRFPFEVRGVTDSDPTVRYGRDEFLPVYNQLVAQEVLFYMSGKVSVKTMLQVIRDNIEIPAKSCITKSFVRVELFEFKRERGKWFFTAGYLEEQQ